MKFVHIADMHFDVPFTTLAKNDLGNLRRLEQRQVLKQIVEYIKQNEIEYLFICGDLYEHEYVRKSTIEFINNQFKEIPNTKIYITPGNHDPRIKESYYNKFTWNDNVFIFDEQVQKVSNEDVDIYGLGFNDFYMKTSKLKDIKIENPEKTNILLTHASLDGANDDRKEYNPISKKDLKLLDFDYIGLGHVHKPYYNDEPNQKIVYPGSTISLGFDELGNHGMIVGNIENNKLELAFIKVDKKEFKEEEMQVDNIQSKEELIEIINERQVDENKYYKIILVGKRNFEINIYEILRNVQTNNIVKIKDETTIKVDLNEIAKQNSLKGIFVKNMLAKINKDNEQSILKAIQIGLEEM